MSYWDELDLNEMKSMSWVENTAKEVDFVVEALELKGGERVLDLACGFGRHSLELSRRGYKVVGVDYTKQFIDDAKAAADSQKLSIEFRQTDALALDYDAEFDVVLNMADGAVGYFATEAENLKLFDVIARALRPGGKHAMGICSAAYFARTCPSRSWQAGNQSLSLADFRWNAKTKRYFYRNRVFQFGEPLPAFPDQFPDDDDIGIRLYTIEELTAILGERGMRIIAAYGDYDTAIPASDKRLMQVVCSRKE